VHRGIEAPYKKQEGDTSLYLLCANNNVDTYIPYHSAIYFINIRYISCNYLK
jgi:hypothetical protein